MLCTECGSQMRMTTEPIVENYKGVAIAASGIEHYVCDACGEYELDPSASDELARRLVDGYAHARGLLAPAEIRDARNRLGMTQAEFESALGVASPTASRWETGVMSPSKSVCKLIRLFVDNPELARSDTRKAAHVYRPNTSSRAAIYGWKVYQGGKPGTPGTRSDTPASAAWSKPGQPEAKEG